MSMIKQFLHLDPRCLLSLKGTTLTLTCSIHEAGTPHLVTASLVSCGFLPFVFPHPTSVAFSGDAPTSVQVTVLPLLAYYHTHPPEAFSGISPFDLALDTSTMSLCKPCVIALGPPGQVCWLQPGPETTPRVDQRGLESTWLVLRVP